MANTGRRHFEDLRGILAQQLSAAADDWATRTEPACQTDPGRGDDTSEVSEALAEKVNGQELRVDDTAALLERTFDYEATEWLLKCVAVPAARTVH